MQYWQGEPTFIEPKLVSFDGALANIQQAVAGGTYCLVAIDQPTIVPNLTGMRPVDRVAASVISWAGGGVQPANRSKIGMFDDDAPLWKFKTKLGAQEDPEAARRASAGVHLIEVFPALALLSISETFCGRLKAPRYNPARRRTFKLSDWFAVLGCVGEFARRLGLRVVATWCDHQRDCAPTKASQDMLDSVICLLVGISWISAPRDDMVLIGDVQNGYMVSPTSEGVRERLRQAGDRNGVMIV